MAGPSPGPGELRGVPQANSACQREWSSQTVGSCPHFSSSSLSKLWEAAKALSGVILAMSGSPFQEAQSLNRILWPHDLVQILTLETRLSWLTLAPESRHDSDPDPWP